MASLGGGKNVICWCAGSVIKRYPTDVYQEKIRQERKRERAKKKGGYFGVMFSGACAELTTRSPVLRRSLRRGGVINGTAYCSIKCVL